MPEGKFTKQEAEKHLRQVNRICRGPLLLSAQEIDEHLKRLAEHADDASRAAHREGLERKHGATLVWPSATEHENVLRLIYARGDEVGKARCGYDINTLILSEPLDGQQHSGQCPQCGTPQIWTPAKYDITD